MLVDDREFLQIDRDEGVFEFSVEEQEHVDGDELILGMRRRRDDHDFHRRDKRSKEKDDERSFHQVRVTHNFGRKGGIALFKARLQGCSRVDLQERATDQPKRGLTDVRERLEEIRQGNELQINLPARTHVSLILLRVRIEQKRYSDEIEHVPDRESFSVRSSPPYASTLPEAVDRSSAPPSHFGACHTSVLGPTTRDHHSRSSPFLKCDCRQSRDPVYE